VPAISYVAEDGVRLCEGDPAYDFNACKPGEIGRGVGEGWFEFRHSDGTQALTRSGMILLALTDHATNQVTTARQGRGPARRSSGSSRARENPPIFACAKHETSHLVEAIGSIAGTGLRDCRNLSRGLPRPDDSVAV
jgi:hypothetical protein